MGGSASRVRCISGFVLGDVLIHAYSGILLASIYPQEHYRLNGLSLVVSKTLFFHVVPLKIVAANGVLQFIASVLIIVIACLVCWGACLIINRWLPWTIGASKSAPKPYTE